MSYTYKYIPASLLITATSGSSPKNTYVDLFNETVRQQFYNSSDWWTIQQESNVGSQVYSNIDVRISHVINAETGLKLGDDWKTLFFSPDSANTTELGKYYIFEDNTWLTTNTEAIKSLSVTCTIRRCNNTLRWIDESTGAYYSEPCIIDYLVKEPRDYATQGSPFMTPGGFLHIETQFNERTNLINENQRFLFGNQEHWTCYKVIGTGLNDFRNVETYDATTARILTIDMIANFVNEELDDVVNGIADVYSNVYTIGLNKTSAQGIPTETIQLTENITYNGLSVNRNIDWATSSSSIATVDTSGLVTLMAVGNCFITGTIEHSSTSASCAITVVSASPVINTEVSIVPNTNYVLEGMTNTYSVYLLKNDVQQSDVFTITCSGSSVPSTSYTFQQTDGNHFTVKNILRNDTSHLIITCTSGSYVETQDIFLRGAW